MNVTIGGIARTVEITSFDKLGDVKVCMLTTTADGSVGFQQLNQEVIDTIYASFPVDTSSGEIASFEDGADNVPVRELKLNLEPYQNLNGYDSPWVGGAGTNIYDDDAKTDSLIDDNGNISANNAWYLSDYCAIPVGTTKVTMTWESTTSHYQARIIAYDSAKSVIANSYISFANSGTYSHTFDVPNNAYYVRVNYSHIVNSVEYPRTNVRVNIGTTDLGYAPYENICPIYPANGKNLYNSATREDGYISATGVVTVDGSSVHSALIPVTPNQPIVFSGKTIGSASSSNKRLHGYNSSGTWVQQLGHVQVDDGKSYIISATVPSGITGVKISFRGTDEYVQVEHGISPSAYVPYNAIGITRTGANLWDEEWEQGGINGNGVPVSGTTRIRSKNFCPILPNTTYYATCGKTDGGNQNRYYLAVFFYDADKNFISYEWENNLTFTTPSNAYYFKLSTNTSVVVYGGTYNNDISINYPSSVRTYEPYQGERYYPISDNPVYGGTLEVETGVLTVTMGVVDLGSLTWTYAGNTDTNYRFQTNLVMKDPPSNGVAFTGFSEGYEIAPWTWLDTAGHDKFICHNSGIYAVLAIRDTSYGNDTASFTSAVSGMHLVYELATPQTYQLTPTQVKTLLGYNNIWTDSGTVEVQYLANIGLYIQKIIGATEDDMVANQNISANKYFFVGEELYYSTSAISAGQTIVVGTNCIKTNLADALNALNS